MCRWMGGYIGGRTERRVTYVTRSHLGNSHGSWMSPEDQNTGNTLGGNGWCFRKISWLRCGRAFGDSMTRA